jgi:hypothetical protein
MNRATADNQSAQAEDEGLEPTKEWVKDLIDEIIADEFSSPDLELHWLDEDADPAELEKNLEARVKLGAVTLNEMRSALGLDLYANPAADRPMVLTATGYVPIEAGVGEEGGGTAQTANESILKAAADDPKHPGWPAGTPGDKGGQFRPKDGDENETSNDGPALTQRKPHDRSAALESGTATDTSSGGAGPDQEHLAAQNGSSLGVFYATRIPKIDQTSFTLLAILTQVVDQLGPRGTLSPSQYGTEIHTQFAAAVRAEGLPGVEVEQTFGSRPNSPYGSKGSIRTDVIFRDVDGKIIAIYDVKTGDAYLEPWRIRQLRAKTDTTADTYVFELNDKRGVVLKMRLGRLGARPDLVILGRH